MLNKYSTTNPKYSTLPTYLDKVRECDRDNLMVDYINKLEQVFLLVKLSHNSGYSLSHYG